MPHSWFSSFYALSTCLSIFWLIVLLGFRTYPTTLEHLIRPDRPSTPFSRQLLASVLFLIQGCRRLAETLVLRSSSSSKIWIGHWLLGIGFYCGMSIAIWIEGTANIIKHELNIHDFEVNVPSARSFLCLLLFTFASGIQHDAHVYLANLGAPRGEMDRNIGYSRSTVETEKLYQLPSHPAFNWTLTPHYLAECVIYFVLALLAAPDGRLVNSTLFCALVFVTVNLGVTAVDTRRWYANTFGPNSVKGRRAMIPFVL